MLLMQRKLCTIVFVCLGKALGTQHRCRWILSPDTSCNNVQPLSPCMHSTQQQWQGKSATRCHSENCQFPRKSGQETGSLGAGVREAPLQSCFSSWACIMTSSCAVQTCGLLLSSSHCQIIMASKKEEKALWREPGKVQSLAEESWKGRSPLRDCEQNTQAEKTAWFT